MVFIFYQFVKKEKGRLRTPLFFMEKNGCKFFIDLDLQQTL